MLSYVAKHSNQRKTAKLIKLQLLASILKLKTINNVELRCKHSKQRKTTKLIKLQLLASILSRNDKQCWVTSQTFKTTQNYKSDQITMNCIDLTSKRSKMLSYVAKHSKQRKSTKVIKIQLLASIRRRKDKKCRVKSQNIQNNAKLQKWSYYDEFASIWRQNDKKCWVTSQNIQNNT